MSLEFSKPRTGYWKNFLLVFKTESLNQALHKKDETVRERALRLHKAAVEDTNRQITMMMALIKSTETNLLTSTSLLK